MKRNLLVKLIALMTVFVLCMAGCAPAAEEAGSTETAAQANGTKLVYWSMWEATEPQGIAIQEAIDAFTAETGVEVEVEFKGRTGIREGLQPALDAKAGIDLFDEDIDRVNTTWADYLMDLEELVAANDYEASANAGLMQACRDVAGGTLKSIPYQPFVFAYFYNPEIFAAAGVEGVPTTWAEFLNVCEKVKNAGYIPITSDDAYINCTFGYHLARLAGEETVLDVLANGNWAENPAVLQTAQAFEELATKGYISPNIASNIWPTGQNTEFALGDVAMYLNGSWLPNEVRSLAGDDFVWGCFSYPALDGGANDTTYANFSAQVFGINKDSENAEVAFQLIEYITKGTYDLRLSELSLGIPADSNNTDWPAQMANVKPVMDEVANRYTWAAGAESNPDVTPILKENFTKLCAGTISAQEFVDAMENATK
jgi:raffinose/stachyose/melibiose transport system substrate-binding protein